MDSSYCKAFICFLDEGYVTGYATLIELMHAMNPKSKLENYIFPICFDIDWKKLDNEDKDTGLGVENPDNPGWKYEKEVFNREFKLIKKRDQYSAIEGYYNSEGEDDDTLMSRDCKEIMAILQPKNKRVYVDNEDYYQEFIIRPLKDKCPGVFEDIIPLSKAKVDNTEHQVESDSNDSENKTFVAMMLPVLETMSLKDFEKLCESVDFCIALRNARSKIRHGGKGLFDYLMAALLRGCDADVYDKKNNKVIRLAAYNYNKYVVVENPDNPKTSDIQYAWTWTTNCRKSMKKEDIPESFINEKGKVKSGKLENFNGIFETLNPQIAIYDVLKKFRYKERGFDTKDNDLIFEAWDLMKEIKL